MSCGSTSWEEQSGHVDDNDLELYLKYRLSGESISAIEAHLARCPACVDKLVEQDKCLWYLAELRGGEGERRKHPRLKTNQAASLQVLNPFSADVWDIQIVDVSTGGLRTHTSKPLLPDSLIRVRMQYSVECGDVRYCIPAEEGFNAGVRLHDYL